LLFEASSRDAGVPHQKILVGEVSALWQNEKKVLAVFKLPVITASKKIPPKHHVLFIRQAHLGVHDWTTDGFNFAQKSQDHLFRRLVQLWTSMVVVGVQREMYTEYH
jgi:hypothetical protein